MRPPASPRSNRAIATALSIPDPSVSTSWIWIAPPNAPMSLRSALKAVESAPETVSLIGYTFTRKSRSFVEGSAGYADARTPCKR
jgi:hypothetical protein